ncbi:MAG: RNA polymerase sigma factor [Phycisphaerae bacterium]
MKRDAQPMTQQPDQVAAAKPCEDTLFENGVAGHIGWIYSMAYRHLADASLADDATQAVFLALWRKHGSLKKPIGGLLVRATRYACNDIQKSQRRRKIREQKAAAMRHEETQGFASAAAEEAKIEQLLAMDAALQRLSTGDRDVLVARFFQNQTARQVAEQFNISEAAAGKRITRAVEKLRHIMARKNIPMDSMALAGLLASGAGTAPGGLTETVLHGIGGKAPISLTAAHAARSITFHTAHIPAIAGAAGVTVMLAAAIGVTAIMPAALKSQQTASKTSSAQIAPAPQSMAAATISSTKPTGVLTCVAYDMLVQHDFAWAVKTGGKLLSGKPGGVQVYDISARVVRALAGAQSARQSVLLGSYPNLHWLNPMPRPLHAMSRSNKYWLYLFNLYEVTGTNGSLISRFQFFWQTRAYAHFLQVRLQSDPGSRLYPNWTPAKSVDIPYTCRGTWNIRAGRVVVLLHNAGAFQKKRWYSATVFDVERYPLSLIQNISYLTRLGPYLRGGPARLKKTAEIAAAWKRYALAHPVYPKSNNKWCKSLLGGAKVTLEGVISGAWPMCPWAPDGRPLAGIRSNDSAASGHNSSGNSGAVSAGDWQWQELMWQVANLFSKTDRAALLNTQLPPRQPDSPPGYPQRGGLCRWYSLMRHSDN